VSRSWLLVFAILAAVFCLGPFLWPVVLSVQPEDGTGGITFAAYGELFQQNGFARSLLNSFLVASITTLLCLGLGASAAFALAKLRFPGQEALLLSALAISMFPPIATVSPLFLVVRALGLRDELPGLVVPYTTFALPLSLWILTTFFREIPGDLYGAARVDGCTPFQAFRKVYLPLAAPGMATTGLLVFIAAWNEFLFALTFTSSPEHRTVPVAISLLAVEHKEPWTQIAAASVLATVPLVVLTVLFQRRIVSGLTAGSLKG